MLWGRFCAEKNILLYVDGVQALGALEVNVEKWNVDFLVTTITSG